MSTEKATQEENWIEAAKVGDISNYDAIKFNHDGKCIAIFHVDGEYFATSGICTHEHAFLSEGYIDHDTIECPLHQGIFNIRTGKAMSPPVTQDLETYETKMEDGIVYVNFVK